MSEKSISVTGIHLLRLSDYVVVCAEIDGRWVEVIREWSDGAFSHIVEPAGMRRAAIQSQINWPAGEDSNGGFDGPTGAE